MLTLTVLDQRLAVCRLDAHVAIPAWATRQPFFSITRTADELSIVCPEQHAPADVQQDIGWRALKGEGPFDFIVTGVMAAIAQPLAAAGIPLLAIATYDTDYVLVKESHLQETIAALLEKGRTVT